MFKIIDNFNGKLKSKQTKAMNELIKNDLVTAMKNQDKFKTSVLRMLKSAIDAEKINKDQ